MFVEYVLWHRPGGPHLARSPANLQVSGSEARPNQLTSPKKQQVFQAGSAVAWGLNLPNVVLLIGLHPQVEHDVYCAGQLLQGQLSLKRLHLCLG